MLVSDGLDDSVGVDNDQITLDVDAGKKHDHVTPLLRDLHWLRVQQRIEYKQWRSDRGADGAVAPSGTC